MYNCKEERWQGEYSPSPRYSPDGQGKLVIPEGVTEIEGFQIKNRDKIVSVEFPSTLQKIEAETFKGCTALVSIDPQKSQGTLKSIGTRAFAGCTQLGTGDTVVFVPKCRLGKGVFSGCTALEFIVLEVRTIPEGCFFGCTALNTVQTKGLKKVGFLAFGSCPKLDERMFEYSNHRAEIDEQAFRVQYVP